MAKNEYYRSRALFFAWDLGVFFLDIRIFQDLRLFTKKHFLKLQILGIIEKFIDWFLL